MNLPRKQNNSESAVPTHSGNAPSAPTPATPLVLNEEIAQAMLFATSIIYGASGTKKTSQIGHFAKYIYEKTGKITRLISMDGGGYGPIQDYINAGIIDAWRLTNEANPLMALTKSSKGAWPEKTVNGLRIGNVVEHLPEDRKKAFERANVGAYAVEGFSSIANAILRDQVAKGRKNSEEIVARFEETDLTLGSKETYGNPGRSHYGFAQNALLDLIRNWSGLPVERVLYTSLEGKGEDRIDKTIRLGPGSAGGAITAALPQYVGDCIHLENEEVDGGIDPETKLPTKKIRTRLYFQSHLDEETKRLWPCKPRVVASHWQELYKLLGKGGHFEITDDRNFYHYLKAQDQILDASTNVLRSWREAADAARLARVAAANQ